MYSLIYISFYGSGFKGLTPTNFETMKIQMNKNANASEGFILSLQKLVEKLLALSLLLLYCSKLMKLIFDADHNILFPCHSIKNV